MRFSIDTWEPEYASVAPEPSDVPTRIDAETDQWAPRSVPRVPPDQLLFIDGVRRVDARVWVSEHDRSHLGLAASYGAGVVACDETVPVATVVAAEVERRLVCGAPSAVDIVTRVGTYRLAPCAGDTPEDLSLGLQQHMIDLEVALARAALVERPNAVVVADGPLRDGHLRGTVGSIKTQHRSYGPPIVQSTVAALAPGQRTPLLLIGGRFSRWSWYLRLPGPVNHPFAGVVRNEVHADLPLEDAIEMADRVSALLPRYASTPAKDSRAPQNLYPIAGLERDLRHRLGDATLVLRALRVAAG